METFRPRFVSKAEREQHKQEVSKPKFSQDALAKSENPVFRTLPDRAPAPSSRKRSRDEVTSPPREDKQQQENLRDLYFHEGPKKRVMKPRDRFNFDWDSTDDTLAKNAPLYEASRPLFGRGFIAGVDRPEKVKQTKSSAEREQHILNENHGISIKYNSKKSSNIKTMQRWDDSGICKELLKAITYKSPTPIQMAAIPFGLAGYNVVGIAQTGTGKTVAFLVPIIQRLMSIARNGDRVVGEGPTALVLVPTRDLALQIEKEALSLSKDGISILVAVGGRSVDSQSTVAATCELMIATPGRLLDLLDRRYMALDRVEIVVVDEADRMMEEMPEDLTTALTAAEGRRQTLMFSATMAPRVETLAKKHMTAGGAATVTVIADASGGSRAVAVIDQQFMVMRDSDKRARLRDVAKSRGSFIVFVNEKTAVAAVRDILRNDGHPVTSIHGEMKQADRESSLDGFRSGKYRFLVATDLASRGIDVPGVSYVVNYDAPLGLDTYRHRIGRTGRAGKSGTAITFLTSSDKELGSQLIKDLEGLKMKVPHDLNKLCKSRH